MRSFYALSIHGLCIKTLLIFLLRYLIIIIIFIMFFITPQGSVQHMVAMDSTGSTGQHRTSQCSPGQYSTALHRLGEQHREAQDSKCHNRAEAEFTNLQFQ
jgi:hypothetical protein